MEELEGAIESGLALGAGDDAGAAAGGAYADFNTGEGNNGAAARRKA